ncbi:MAG TPA: hypothetical protein VIM68_10135 [Thermoanaerobaculia bacterium]
MTFYLFFVFLAIYNAGCMTTLQLQHYGIYPSVGKENFKNYMGANNRAAALPTIVPAMLLLLASVVLMFYRPAFVRLSEATAFLILNIIALASTFTWQRPLHSEMAEVGYDEAKVRKLIATNWIRTISHLLIAILAIAILPR